MALSIPSNETSDGINVVSYERGGKLINYIISIDSSGNVLESMPVTVSAALPAGDNNIGNIDLASAIPAGTNLIGKVGIDQTTPGTTNAIYTGGSIFTLKSAPAVGAKTVTTSAAAIFAGGTVLASRYIMTVYNESSYTVYWGPTGVTTATGYPILPGDSVTFQFSPTVSTAIYMIASASSAIRVMEAA